MYTVEQNTHNIRDLIGLFHFKVYVKTILDWMAHSSVTDVKTSVIKLNFAISLQNVSNVVEATSPVNARNQNKTPYMCKLLQTTSVQLHRKWSKSKVHTGITTSVWYSNLNKHNSLCLIGNNFPKLPQPSSSFNWHNHKETKSDYFTLYENQSVSSTSPNKQTIEMTETLFLRISKK
jgi:hypothetical protein